MSNKFSDDLEKRHDKMVKLIESESDNSQEKKILSEKSFIDDQANINTNDVMKYNGNINIYVGKNNSFNGNGKYIGCYKNTNTPNTKTDYNVPIKHNISEEEAYNTCHNAALLTNNPYFSISGKNIKESQEINYSCRVGNEQLLNRYIDTGKAFRSKELNSFKKDEIKNKIGSNIDGKLKVEDGNLKLYTNSGSLLTYANNENGYTVENNVFYAFESRYFDSSVKDILEEDVIALSSNFFEIIHSLNTDWRNSFKKQDLLDNSKTHMELETICNDFRNCVGYQYVKTDNDEQFIILYNKIYHDIKNDNKILKRSHQNLIGLPLFHKGIIKECAFYHKPKNFIKSELSIENNGEVILNINGSPNVLMKPSNEDKKIAIGNPNYINGRKNQRNTLKDGETLQIGEYISSDNGKFRAIMNENGYFVLEGNVTSCPQDRVGNYISTSDNNNEQSDAVYYIDNYNYSTLENESGSGSNDIKYFNYITKGECMNNCNLTDNCNSFTYYKNQAKTCILHKSEQPKLNKHNGATFHKKNNNNKNSDIELIGKSGYIDNKGFLFEHTDEGKSYYNIENKDKITNWTQGYTSIKNTIPNYYDNNDETDKNLNGVKQYNNYNIDECADVCNKDNNCGAFTYYKDDDGLKCETINENKNYEHIPHKGGFIYKRRPDIVKNNEYLSSSVNRDLVNVDPNVWKKISNKGTIVKEHIKGPLEQEFDDTNNFIVSDIVKRDIAKEKRQARRNQINDKNPDIIIYDEIINKRKSNVEEDNNILGPEPFTNRKITEGYDNIDKNLSNKLNQDYNENEMQSLKDMVKVYLEQKNNNDTMNALDETTMYDVEKENYYTARLIILLTISVVASFDILSYVTKK